MDAGGSLGLDGIVFDAVIIGTGLPESILSAALSLAGARVLHLDSNAFYGSHHASLRLEEVQRLAEKSVSLVSRSGDAELTRSVDAKPMFGASAKVVPIRLASTEMQSFPTGCRLSLGSEEFVSEHGSRVILDLAARTVLAAGSLVDLLVKTGVGHYLSFRPIDATYLYLPSPSSSSFAGGLQKVPASRSDVFRDKCLSIVEKRLLMRFLKSRTEVLADGEGQSGRAENIVLPSDGVCKDSGMTFSEFLVNEKLTGNLCEFVRHCIAFVEDISPDNPDQVSAPNGCSAVRTYLNSLMRYQTPTPFLYPNHGAGEMCEAFCRLSAVHGGTFILRKEACAMVLVPTDSEIGTEASSCTSSEAVCGVVTTDGDLLRTRHIYLSNALCGGGAKANIAARTPTQWRFVCILTKSAFPQESPRVLSVFPRGCSGNVGATVRVLQMNSTVEMCPEGLFIVYAEVVGRDGSESDIAYALGKLVTFSADDEERFEDGLRKVRMGQSVFDSNLPSSEDCERPIVAWSMWYARHEGEENCEKEGLGVDSVTGLSVVNDVAASVDAARAVAEAKRCFRLTRSSEEFFSDKQLD